VPSLLNWAIPQTRPILMIPGPTELPYPVIQAMNQPPAIQYDQSFDEGVLEPTTLALRDVFQTQHEVILLPGSGRTALEAGAASVIEAGDPVLVVDSRPCPDPVVMSNTVSCVRTSRGIEPAAVVARMRDQYGILIGTGLAEMRTFTLRIGTMGITASPQFVLPTLSALELALRDLGATGQAGAGVAAAQTVFAGTA